MQFDSPPSIWPAYARVLAARKPALLPEGAVLPRIEARLEQVAVDGSHLSRYREVCGLGADDTLPPAYPHVLATPVQLALLSSPAFPVGLLGLVHVRNRIEQRRPLLAGEPLQLLTSIEGHRETPRGQEFDLHTEIGAAGGWLWRECCTFLARRRSGRGTSTGAPAAAAPEPAPAASGPVTTLSLRAGASLGRDYARVSGDINPIHLADFTARAFGFRGAIAHGMWSLARCAAELPARLFAQPLALEIEFRAPVFLPAWVMLHQWPDGDGAAFELRDAQGERVHLRGALQPLH